MPRGGPRPNSGRPPKAITVTTREDAANATAAVGGLTPARVMAENLRFWYDAAMNLTDKIQLTLDKLDPKEFAPEDLQQLNGNLKNMLFARARAQECAVDLAPYRHPRLANIEMTASFDEDATRAPLITHKTDPKDAVRAYEALLKEGI